MSEYAVLPPWSTDPADATNPPPALGDLFAVPAARWPDRRAIADGTTAYTFAQLEQGARAVAAWLADQGVGPGDRVAVLTEKWAVVPVLAVAIWKRGAVYAPLDAAEPADRVEELLARLRPAAVIALDDRGPAVPGARLLGGEQLAAVLAAPAAPGATAAHRPEDAAYIVFASGATGEPQGVEIGVAALVACFGHHNEVLRFTAESRVFSLSPFHVDVSMQDTLLPLSLGAFVYQFRSLPAGPVMRRVLARERTTHLIAVSMLLTTITGDGRQITREALPDLELVMTGAEVCDPAILNTWVRQLPEARVVHAFGPPEATVFCLTHQIGPEDGERSTAYPIGRPLRGTTAKIVEDGTEIHRPGAEGELWVGGEQLMRGYFDRPEETARRVVERDGSRFFRTGDICSYDDDGDIVFHRHDDEDVRWMAGRRSHLGEIRRVALRHPGVERAAVAVVRRDRRDRLAMHVTARASTVPRDLRRHLHLLLPAYLRPTLLVFSPAEGPGADTDEHRVMGLLAAAVQRSNAVDFVLTADGAVQPSDEAE